MLKPYPLQQLGYDERYILYPCGKVYDTKRQCYCKMYKHNYSLRLGQDAKGKAVYASVSLRTLYKQAYNQIYVIDNIPNLDGEEWLDISVIDKFQHLKGLYKISNMGRIKSYQKYEAIILQPFENRNGYEHVEIDSHNMKVSRLVLMAFCPTDDETLEADHRDNNKHNNQLSNLQWLSKQDNISKYWKDYYQQQEEEI